MKKIIFILGVIVILAIGVLAVNGKKTDDKSFQEAKDPVYMGGIILCNEHKVSCGVKDGICPEDYYDKLCKPKDPDCR